MNLYLNLARIVGKFKFGSELIKGISLIALCHFIKYGRISKWCGGLLWVLKKVHWSSFLQPHNQHLILLNLSIKVY